MNTYDTTSDITFIGSGISTSFSIINFLDLINTRASINDKISISIIEKYSEFNIGIPYGSRSGFSTLLITSLRNFLIEPELSLFIKWLNKNKTWLLEEFEKEGGILSKKWIQDNKDDIQNNRWKELFIPRRFFGCYINLRVNNKIKELSEKGYINVNFISGEVTDIEKNENTYKISLQNNYEIVSKKVVLSVGSLPINYLWKNKDIIQEKNLMFVNNPYKPELGIVLNKINNFIKSRDTKKATNILIVGANASALELIYKINDFSNEEYKNTNFTFLSTQGTIPDAIIDEERQKKFIPNYLNELKKEKNVTAKSIAHATFKDLDRADEINLGAASTVDIVSKYFGVLLEDLNPKELEIFACQYGNQIGKRQRCAGLHYSNVITDLEKQNRFVHIAGRFSTLSLASNGDYNLEYIDTGTKNETTHTEPFHVIINCVGSKNLNSEDLPILYQNLIKKNYCTPNQSNIGFHVNKSLEAHKNLHIMGPMLAGNVIGNRAVWHVEHCGRIIWLSKILSKILFDDLYRNDNYTPKSYELEIHSLNSDAYIKRYRKLLIENWNNNIYYAYDHLKYFENETNVLKYFLFKVNGSSKVLMPIILRQVEVNGEKTKHFDAITPYGYSGPLYNGDVTEECLKEFWKAVDNWYKENNVITEFIRFSLNGNYSGYNGLLINTLNNVKGTLVSDFDLHWLSFLPKVRNNYRKAVSYNLEVKIFDTHDINENIIQIFFDIYTETMKRLNAKAIYFFSLNYFKSLILNNLNEFSIAFAYLDNIPISTELIIKNDKTIFAFLGGTDANYYSYRPNDFLRVEIIKWAVKSNLKYYVLGGGLKDKDGLYKSKKALFPKNEDVVFYTGRKIINYEVYERLCGEHIDDYAQIHKEELKNYFFPLYRFNNR